MLHFDQSNTVVCYACGAIMVIQGEDDLDEVEQQSELTASFSTCPHCKTVDEVQVEGGQEWCSACGLDPNIDDYPAEQLASLWRDDSGIQNMMQRGVPKPNSRMYKFLTNYCGPHCAYAGQCPQTTRNFATCLREEVLDDPNEQLLQDIGDDVGSKSGRRQRRRERKAEEARIRKEKERAVLVYAGSGWYDRKYRNEAKDTQGLTHTGSGSGT